MLIEFAAKCIPKQALACTCASINPHNPIFSHPCTCYRTNKFVESVNVDPAARDLLLPITNSQWTGDTSDLRFPLAHDWHRGQASCYRTKVHSSSPPCYGLVVDLSVVVPELTEIV